MSLTTTMGVELTYVPAAIQIALDRGAGFDPDHAPDSSLVGGFCTLMRHMVQAKKIPVQQVGTDPGCVEIPTRPYSKLSQLLSVARRLGREAQALGLTTNAEYTNGGGAHIHTGVIGDTEPDRDMYKARMMLFCAMNPWLAWATLNVNDDINAKPICRHMLTQKTFGLLTPQGLCERIEEYRRSILRAEAHLHTPDIWGDLRARIATQRRLNRYKVESNANRVPYYRMVRAEMQSGSSKYARVRDISLQHFKEYMVRFTSYGVFGTVEFRCFEMGDEAKLKRNILLANAICRYVERWDITEYNPKDVMSGSTMRKIKWSAAKAGWLGMLAKLGMDAREYRAETAQLALRWRWSRAAGQNPTAADATERRPTADNTDRDPTPDPRYAARVREAMIARCRGRRERREARRAARAGA